MRPRPHLPRIGTALGVLAASGMLAAASPHAALVLGPALLLFLILAAGAFPGERTLARARARRARPRAPRVASRVPRPVLPDVVRPVGSALAFALAMRPPPGVHAGT
ncbi:hypothetical protein [Patulibacter minatonensis]|uniref:hypothetical protein n=1 Tax=Patulibacter minatonensis TaxID=298163 RepID=UPI00047BB26B|nr:hypothetical protein [Patulibacter minatonensis]